MKMPAFQFYPADWRKDPGVQALSRHDRSVWFDMLCIMHESDERGVLLLNGKPMPETALASMLGLDNKTFNQTLAVILSYGVASRRESDGAIYSRRMVKDQGLRQTRADGGKRGAEHGIKGKAYGAKGGRPSKTTGDNKPPSNPPPSSSSSTSVTSDDVSAQEASSSSSGSKLSQELTARLATLPDTSGEVAADQSPVLCQPAAFQALCDELGLGPIDHEHYRSMVRSAAKEKPGTRNEAQWRGFVRNFITNQKQRGPLLPAKAAALSAPTPPDQLPPPGQERPGQLIVIMGIESDASMNRMKLDNARKKWPTATVHAFIPGQRHD
jgi:hypothetical protein